MFLNLCYTKNNKVYLLQCMYFFFFSVFLVENKNCSLLYNFFWYIFMFLNLYYTKNKNKNNKVELYLI